MLLAALGGGFFLFRKKPPPASEEENQPTETEILPTIDASVEISLTPRADRKEVKLSIKRIPADVTALEYELSYFTGGGLSRGTFTPNPIELRPEEREFSRDILLGTCSRNTCTYDEGVTKVTLTVKFHSPKGASQFKKDFPL